MRVMLTFVVIALASVASLAFADELPLLKTGALEWSEKELPDRLMDGAHKFVERKIAESVTSRAKLWARDFSSKEAYFYCPLVFIESKVLWDILFRVLMNQEGSLPWTGGLKFGELSCWHRRESRLRTGTVRWIG